jgi:RNA polymerase sigma-70 factor (ECF subfamily)
MDIKTRGSQVERIHRREIAESVRGAIGELTPKLRIPILLKYVEGMSYDEIADALGLSMGTVSSRLNRGHKMLARKLEHLRGELAAGE